MMNSDLINSVWLGLSFLALFTLSEWLYHKFKINAEYTRKIVHAGTGLITFLFPVFLSSHWWVLILCISFALILIASLKYNLLKSINAVERVTWGSLCYPAAVYLCFLAFEFNSRQPFLYYLPILILALCDPLAALAGRRWPFGKYSIFGNDKSLLGSAVFAVIAFGISIPFLLNYSPDNLTIIKYSIVIAFVSSIAEAFSTKGFDNLTIPVSVILVCLMFL